jgi:drug/metabolite transporter (DMT)-like permease
MTISVFAIVLLAAAFHATWNALIKGGGDKLLTTVLITGSAAAIAMVALPLLAVPARACWPFVACSAVLSISYFALVARIYRVADMSATYPLMRGTAPLIVAIASVAFMGEPLVPLAWLGIAIICAGILSMAIGQRSAGNQGVALSLLNALVIAAYTLIDGAGVRRSGSPAAYTLWIFLLTGVPLVVWALAVRGAEFRSYVAGNWRSGLTGGLGTVISYGLALWAMTVAPVPVVAALRETSILFGVAISGLVLKERVSAARIAGACIIAAGAVALRLG